MYEQLCSDENLYLAYRKAARGKRGKAPAAHFEYRLEDNRAMYASLTELNLAHDYWVIPGIKLDLPRLSAWIGSDGLQFAVRHCGGGSKRE